MTGGPAGEGSNLGLYWGDDAYAIERAIDALAQRVGSAAGGPPERWRVGGDATSASLIGERLATTTMFGGGSLAIVSEPWPLLRSKAGREELAGVLGNVAPGNALALTATLDFTAAKRSPHEPATKGPIAADAKWGDFATGAAGGEVKIDAVYTTPMEHHNPMEPHATVARTLHASTRYHDASNPGRLASSPPGSVPWSPRATSTGGARAWSRSASSTSSRCIGVASL